MEALVKNAKKKITVTEHDGIFRVTADFKNGFHLVPSPLGRINLAFWDEGRMKVFLKNFGFYPVIHDGNN